MRNSTFILALTAAALVNGAGCRGPRGARVQAELRSSSHVSGEVRAVRVGALAVPGLDDARTPVLDVLGARHSEAKGAWRLDVEVEASRKLRLEPTRPQTAQFGQLSGLDPRPAGQTGPAFNPARSTAPSRIQDGMLMRARLVDPQGARGFSATLWVPRRTYEDCPDFWLQHVVAALGREDASQIDARCPRLR